MFGLIGDFTTLPGKREEVIARIIEGSRDMPGCLSYIVSRDAKDPDKLWITEVWDSAESSKASVHYTPVAIAIDSIMPLMARLGELTVTEPVGGVGL
jgi:quinol monooxygenase YgiN